MLSAEILIKQQADDFKDRIEPDHKRNSHLDFKDKLAAMLYNYDEKVDKLLFLYQTMKNIDALYETHLLSCSSKDHPEKCHQNVHYSHCKFFTEQEIRRLNPTYEYSILRPNINSDLIKQNFLTLINYPEAAKLYQTALDKINEEKFERNLLDDLRLALETILKQLLQNNKPLEKQNNELGKYLQAKNISVEVRNMFVLLKDYFTKYQNEYVKHNDKVNKLEIELMLNLTSTFINFLLNV